MTLTSYDSMHVERVADTPHSSHIEPQLNPLWPAWRRLTWHAAVARADCGLDIIVGSDGIGSARWRLEVGSHILVNLTYAEARAKIDGLAVGYQIGFKAASDD